MIRLKIENDNGELIDYKIPNKTSELSLNEILTLRSKLKGKDNSDTTRVLISELSGINNDILEKLSFSGLCDVIGLTKWILYLDLECDNKFNIDGQNYYIHKPSFLNDTTIYDLLTLIARKYKDDEIELEFRSIALLMREEGNDELNLDKMEIFYNLIKEKGMSDILVVYNKMMNSDNGAKIKSIEIE